MDKLLDALDRYELPAVMAVGALWAAIIAVEHDSPLAWGFLFICVIAFGYWLVRGLAARPKSPVAKWLHDEVRVQTKGILRGIDYDQSEPANDAFTDAVCGLLTESEAAGALCGHKDLGVDNVLQYYEKFFEFAERRRERIGDGIFVMRAFVQPYNATHVEAHRRDPETDERRPAVLALTVEKENKQHIESHFRGWSSLLERGFGVVILVKRDQVHVIIHEERKGVFVFWSVRDRVVIEHLVRLYKRICKLSEEYEDREAEIKQFIAKIDDALERMPTRSERVT